MNYSILFKTAVIIPVYKQYQDLDHIERISFTQKCKALCKHDIYIVTYKGINLQEYRDKVSCVIHSKEFDKDYFKNIEGYNKLLVTIDFYEAFEQYDYMLISQLDVFVFNDAVDYFAAKGYDYIGAPWFDKFNVVPENDQIVGVGNGGFSLRKISSFIFILRFLAAFDGKNLSIKIVWQGIKHPVSLAKVIKHEWMRTRREYFSILPWEFTANEDYYWAEAIPAFFSWFRVGSIPDAIAFAFEVNPRLLYKMNGYKLPMAVHAWQKHDLAFWRPFIEELGYQLPD